MFPMLREFSAFLIQQLNSLITFIYRYAIILPIICLTGNEIWRRKTVEILVRIPIFRCFRSSSNSANLSNLKTSGGKRMIFSAEYQNKYHFEELKKLWN